MKQEWYTCFRSLDGVRHGSLPLINSSRMARYCFWSCDCFPDPPWEQIAVLMFVNRGHKYLKQSLSGQASSTAQRSKHSLPLKTLVIEDERRSVAFHTSLVFPSVTTADECTCHASPSLCLFVAEEWRGPVLGVWRKQGELLPFPAWLWCLSVGERRPTGPLLHWSTQTMDRDLACVDI